MFGKMLIVLVAAIAAVALSTRPLQEQKSLPVGSSRNGLVPLTRAQVERAAENAPSTRICNWNQILANAPTTQAALTFVPAYCFLFRG